MALVLIPQSVAYAQLAGLPPTHGLATAAIAPGMAAIFGSARYLQTGPAATTSLLTLSALSQIGPVTIDEYVGAACLLAVLVGLIRVLLWALRAGRFVYLLSEPALHGFMAAAAMLIVATQVPALLGVSASSSRPLVGAQQALAGVGQWHLGALAAGSCALAILLLGRKRCPRLPLPALVTAMAIALVSFGLGLGPVVQNVPTGLPDTPILAWHHIGTLLAPAAVLAVLGFAEVAGIARQQSAGTADRWNPDRELLGQGLASVACGLLGGSPPGGSLSRSALNLSAGATSRWSSFLAGAIVLVCLPVVDVLESLPRSILAAVVIASSLRSIDLRSLAQDLGQSKPQGAIACLTFVVTLIVSPNLQWAVLTGLGAAVLVHLWRELLIDCTADLHSDLVLHVHLHGVLFYGSSPLLADRLIAATTAHPTARAIVLHIGGLGRVDLSGMRALADAASMVRPLTVTLSDIPPHARRLAERLLPAPIQEGGESSKSEL